MNSPSASSDQSSAGTESGFPSDTDEADNRVDGSVEMPERHLRPRRIIRLPARDRDGYRLMEYTIIIVNSIHDFLLLFVNAIISC